MKIDYLDGEMGMGGVSLKTAGRPGSSSLQCSHARDEKQLL